MTVRLATVDDLDWLVDLAVICHPTVNVVPNSTRKWFETLMLSQNTIAVRGDHSAAFGIISVVPWNGVELLCELAHLFSDPSSVSPMEPVRLLRFIQEVSQMRGCKQFFIVSTAADLTPFAEKIGAKRVGSIHVVDAP